VGECDYIPIEKKRKWKAKNDCGWGRRLTISTKMILMMKPLSEIFLRKMSKSIKNDHDNDVNKKRRRVVELLLHLRYSSKKGERNTGKETGRKEVERARKWQFGKIQIPFYSHPTRMSHHQLLITSTEATLYLKVEDMIQPSFSYGFHLLCDPFVLKKNRRGSTFSNVSRCAHHILMMIFLLVWQLYDYFCK